MEEKYDIAIIGSGLGGLSCGAILAKEGYKVCILEKNQQFGGCLQTFKKDNVVFDTGVHYVGGLDKGQSLHRYFEYFDILDKLRFKKMDPYGFDKVSFEGDEKEYSYAMGIEKFAEVLCLDFPEECEAIKQFALLMKEIGLNYPFYHLTDNDYNEIFNFKYLDVSLVKYLDEHFKSDKLKSVLTGTNLLYAGRVDSTTLYEHALIIHSFIESSYRFIDGAGQIANAMVRNIRKLGGKVKRYQKVVKIHIEDNLAKCIELANGKKIYADKFISNVHPQITMEMLEGASIRKSYINRINRIPNSASAFALHIVLKENKVPYINHNVYHFKTSNVWNGEEYTPENWPLNYMAFTPISSKSDVWADSLIAICYMNYEDVQKWGNTENVVGFETDRGKDYEAFKENKSKQFLKELYKRFPEIKDNVVSYCSSTPLTYKDYLYSPEGSIYGYRKDFNSPILSFVSPQTKIENLLFTGQNINMHGVLGVTVSAFATCGEILGKKYLYNKVKIVKS